jgi:hypothetical protein
VARARCRGSQSSRGRVEGPSSEEVVEEIAGVAEGLEEAHRRSLWMIGLVAGLKVAHARISTTNILAVVLEDSRTSLSELGGAVVVGGCYSMYYSTAVVADAAHVKGLRWSVRSP